LSPQGMDIRPIRRQKGRVKIRTGAQVCTFIWLLLCGCATHLVPPDPSRSLSTQARQALRNAESKGLTAHRAAAWDLVGADLASRNLGDPFMAGLYDSACARFTEHIYRSDQFGPQQFQANGKTYQLQSPTNVQKGGWNPGYFQKVKVSGEVKAHLVKPSVRLPGVGGTLIGIRRPADPKTERNSFAPANGYYIPVTASLDFQDTKENKAASVRWQLNDPTDREFVSIRGKVRPLAADFSAPLNFYPKVNQFWLGLLGFLNADRFHEQTGLYLLEPYRDDRIPVVLVHGLLSIAEMWAPIINELREDPVIRKNYQFWVFYYPTGDPVPVSSLYLREDLAKAERLYRPKNGIVLVGHSMGGLLSRAQATDSGRALWDASFGKNAERLYLKVGLDNLVKKSLVFRHDPNIQRIVFMNTPHRGSQLAVGLIGRMAIRFVHLPAALVRAVTDAVGEIVVGWEGDRALAPTSIHGLSPKSPYLLAMEKLPIHAPHHSIIGDRGRRNTPDSTDGIVPYWSSHLVSAESELIVPGDHGSFRLPQSIAELRRILREHVAKKHLLSNTETRRVEVLP
jgi:pimeloyl-ACP methyl ester carboxylesterase